MQARIATLSLVVLMVVALLLAGRWQGPEQSPASGQLQAASAGVNHVADPAPPITPDPDRAPTPAELDDAVWQKLQQPISVAFEATLLTDVVAYLADATGTQTYLDLRALEDAAIPPDAPVTIELTHLPAEMVLDVVLRQLDLDYRLHAGAIIITTADVADQQTKVRTYPVGDLVGQDFDLLVELIELIKDAVAPDSWSEQGGMGSIAPFDKTLVVTQTDRIQRQIQLLLQQLRIDQRMPPGMP